MAEKGTYIYEWPRPMVTVDIAVFAFLQGLQSVLLIERGADPFKGHWALPGGFVEMDEELCVAAARELAEETSLTGLELKQLCTVGTIGRDPRGRLITIVYTATAKDCIENIKAGDDAAQAKWFSIKDLPEKIAFDHRDIIKTALKWYEQV